MRKRGIAFFTIAAAVAVLVPSTTPSGAGARRVTFGKPVKVSANDSQSAAEPSIRGSRDGSLYIVAPQGLTAGIRPDDDTKGGDVIWRSDNGGRTWKFLGSYDDRAGGGDADIAPDRSGDLWGSGLTLVNTTATYSEDKGESWKVNPIGTVDTVVDRQWIETYRNKPFAFMTTGEISTQQIVLSRLELLPNDTPTVVKTIRVSDPTEQYQWPGEIAVANHRNFVYVGYNNSFDSPTDENRDRDNIVVTRSTLDLNTTKRFIVAKSRGDTFDSFVAVDSDKAGNVYAVWTERRPKGKGGRYGRTNSYLARSRNLGKTWSKPIKLNNRRARTTTFPWVVAGSKGRVAVAFYGTRALGPSPEAVHKKGARPPRWKVWVSYSRNAAGRKPRFVKKRALRKTIHKGNICTSGTGCSSGTRDLLDFFQLDLDACGEIIIAYTDNSRDVVTRQGTRPVNRPEYIYFVRQTGGPRFYRRPLNPAVC